MLGLPRWAALTNFNPRSPWGERQTELVEKLLYELFQSTLPVGGATFHYYQIIMEYKISIHAPRGGSDSL